MGQSAGNQFFYNEWFEKLKSHFLWQTALINLKFRTNDDNGTAGIVNTFTQQVLTETTLFTFR